jgi:hypothetical protein
VIFPQNEKNSLMVTSAVLGAMLETTTLDMAEISCDVCVVGV